MSNRKDRLKELYENTVLNLPVYGIMVAIVGQTEAMDELYLMLENHINNDSWLSYTETSLECAFSWWETPQGNSYWERIHKLSENVTV